MFAGLPDVVFSPTGWLWLIAAWIAATLMFAAINRRRNRLTESLRAHVQQTHRSAESVPDRARKPAPPVTDSPSDAAP